MIDLLLKINRTLHRRVNSGMEVYTSTALVQKCFDMEFATQNDEHYRHEVDKSRPTASRHPRRNVPVIGVTTASRGPTASVTMPGWLKDLPRLTPELKKALRKENRCLGCRKKTAARTNRTVTTANGNCQTHRQWASTSTL